MNESACGEWLLACEMRLSWAVRYSVTALQHVTAVTAVTALVTAALQQRYRFALSERGARGGVRYSSVTAAALQPRYSALQQV